MKIRKRFLNALCLLSNLFKWTKSIPRQSQPVPPHRVLIASLFRTSSYRVIERARGFTRLYEVALSHHTERYRIPSNRINQRGGERGGRNSKCRHEGLDRGTGEPRTTQSGRGYSWKSSFFVIEEGEKERERGEGRRSGIEEDTLGIRVIHLSLPGHFDLRRGEKYFGCENVQIARSDSKGGRSLARVGGLDERSEEQRRRRTSKRQLERWQITN